MDVSRLVQLNKSLEYELMQNGKVVQVGIQQVSLFKVFSPVET
jgi:hypothetical protein